MAREPSGIEQRSWPASASIPQFVAEARRLIEALRAACAVLVAGGEGDTHARVPGGGSRVHIRHLCRVDPWRRRSSKWEQMDGNAVY
jgi:hypothetical protein